MDSFTLTHSQVERHALLSLQFQAWYLRLEALGPYRCVSLGRCKFASISIEFEKPDEVIHSV